MFSCNTYLNYLYLQYLQCLSEDQSDRKHRFWLFVSGHRQQDDITEPGHHIWAEPAAQAEELREGVQRPELGPYGGQRRHHRRRPAHDRHAPNPVHGRSADLLT